MADSAPPVLLVRYRAGVVGLTRRMLHVVPLPSIAANLMFTVLWQVKVKGDLRNSRYAYLIDPTHPSSDEDGYGIAAARFS